MPSVAQGKESWNRPNSSEHFRPYLISLRGRLGWAGARWACNLWAPSLCQYLSIISQWLFNNCSIAFNLTFRFLPTFSGTCLLTISVLGCPCCKPWMQCVQSSCTHIQTRGGLHWLCIDILDTVGRVGLDNIGSLQCIAMQHMQQPGDHQGQTRKIAVWNLEGVRRRVKRWDGWTGCPKCRRNTMKLSMKQLFYLVVSLQ